MIRSMEDQERQPLLTKGADTSSQASDVGLPWVQITVLAIWRSTHAIYFGFILTWITRFILLNELADENSVGRVAGWIESAYSLGVLLGLAPASYLSDSWGRKPTAMSGILFASAGTIAFGFAKTLTQLVALRFFIGFFVAFLPATILTTFVELSNASTLPLIFTVNTIAWRFGILIAPTIGGLLAEPAVHYPTLFQGTVWERYPYALSGVVASAMPLLATLLGLFVVKETLPSDRRRSFFAFLFTTKRQQEMPTYGNSQSSGPLRAMFTKPVCFMLFLWGLYVFMQMTGVVAEVLFLSSPVKVGGLNLAPREMALLYTARPVMSSASNLLIYPVLARRYSTEAIFRWGVTLNNTAYYGIYLAFGLYAAAYHPSHAVSLALLFLLSIPVCLNGSTATACTHALTSRAPSKAYLARITTAQEYFANAAHGLGSICGSNAWALSVTYGLMRGQAVWLFLFVLAIVVAGLSSLLTEQKSWEDEEENEVETAIGGESAIVV